ncbi:MAG: hypothetical protein ACRCSU_13775 [Paracoccaceae bacterium]
MKSLLVTASAALLLSIGSVQAGGLAEPTMDPDVIVEDTSSGSDAFVVPLLLLLVIAAAVSAD